MLQILDIWKVGHYCTLYGNSKALINYSSKGLEDLGNLIMKSNSLHLYFCAAVLFLDCQYDLALEAERFG